MDTISRENNSMLPVGGIIVGAIALLLGAYAAITLSKVNKTLGEHDAKIAKVDAVEATANQAVDATQKLEKKYTELRNQTQGGFDQIGPIIGNLQASVTKLEEAAKKPVVAEKGKKGEPAVAGPGEYIVKSGDGGTKIATKLGVSITALQEVNPGVNWNKLSVGQKLKVPSKK